MSHSLGKHTVANLIGLVAPMVVAICTVPIYLRNIGPERYGTLAIIMALLGYFGFFDLGMGRAVTRRLANLSEATADERSNLLWTALATAFLLGLVGSFVLWLGAGYLLSSTITMPDATRQEALSAVTWLLVALPILLPSTALTGALHARLRYLEANSIQIVGGLLGQLVPLSITYAGYVELAYLVPATLAARLISVLLLFVQCRKHVPLTGFPCIEQQHLKPMLSYGGWVSVIAVLSPLLVTIDRLVIGALSGARAVASYTVPYDLVSRAMVISGSFYTALFPRLAADGGEAGRALADRATKILIVIMTPTVLAALGIAQPFMILWMGENFASTCRGVAEVILVGVWINALVIPYHAHFLATQNPRTVALIFLLEIPIYFFFLWVGIKEWGVVGAAVAWCIRVLIDTVLLLRLNGALLRTLNAATSSALLLAISGLGIFISDSTALSLTLTLVLITASAWKDRRVLTAVSRHILPRKNTPHAN